MGVNFLVTVSVDTKPMMGAWGFASPPVGSTGRAPWSWNHFSFQTREV